jgi:DNA-binding MarR family transcriptional regulator
MRDLDLVDAAVDGWAARYPDLDVASMRTFLLLARVSHRAVRRVDAAFEVHGITPGEFDVLAALLTAPDDQLRPSQLAALALLSPAGMTNRIDRLEAAGMVARHPDPADRRGSLVQLTASGRATVEAAAPDHVAVEAVLLAPLSLADRDHLDRILTAVLAGLADDESGP